MTADHGIRSETTADGIQQQHLQRAAMDGVLRDGITGIQTTGFGPDESAVFGVITQDPRAYGTPIERIRETEISQRLHRVRQQIDPDTERPDLIDSFEDPHRDPCSMQSECRSKSADAGSDDGNRSLSLFMRFVAVAMRVLQRIPGFYASFSPGSRCKVDMQQR